MKTYVFIKETTGDKIVRSPKTCFRCGKKNLKQALKFGSFVLDKKILEIEWTSFCGDCTELIREFVGINKGKS